MKIWNYAAMLAFLALPTAVNAQDEGAADEQDQHIKEPQELVINPAAPAADQGSELKAKVALEGLNNPSGVAIQPETGVVFVADSGNHQIVKLVDGTAEAVITEFPKDVYGKGPKVNVGPLGLLFLDKNTLVIGGGGQPDGDELLRVYKLPEDGSALKADAMSSSHKLAASDDLKGEGNFYALASDGKHVYVTCNGDDTKGWVGRATIKDGDLADFERYLATKEATEVDAPVGIAFSPESQGRYLVVGQMGEISVPGDSLLTFYQADKKKMRLNVETGLNDITAVAYSKRGYMYVLDYSWADATQGGLFQIVNSPDADSGIEAKRIMTLDKPTAMAFSAAGELYITVLGEAENADSKGLLIRVPVEAEL